MTKNLVFATFGLLAVGATLWALDDRGKPTKTPPLGKPAQPPTAVAPGFPGVPPGAGQPPQGFPGGAPGGFQPPGGGPFPGFGPPGGRTDYKELIPALIDTLGDPDADVRKNVVHALGHLGQSAVTPLLDILKDKDKSKEARANAAYALGKIGPQARGPAGAGQGAQGPRPRVAPPCRLRHRPHSRRLPLRSLRCHAGWHGPSRRWG